LRERGGRVIVACSTESLPVFSPAPAVDAAVPLGDSLPEHDLYVPLLSLPWLMSKSNPGRCPQKFLQFLQQFQLIDFCSSVGWQ
jgi:hypothetical protein